MAKEFKLSAERLEELKQELNYLKTVREKEVADQIKEARSFGDLSENSEYDEAKNEQGKLYSRIAEVENILSNYVVIEEHESDPNSVRLGSTVKVMDLEFEEEETYQVVGSQEADPMNGRISEDSPFGRALLGRSVGDEVDVYVIGFDPEKKKISLGMKDRSQEPWTVFTSKYSVGDVANVRIVKLMTFGAFAEIVPGVDGLIHISQIADHRVEKPGDELTEGQMVDAKIIAIDEENKKVSLSIRALLEGNDVEETEETEEA